MKKNDSLKVTTPVDVKEKEPILKRLTTLKNTLKLGSHHKMERFVIIMGGTLSLLLISSTLSFAAYRSDIAAIATTQAIYTKNLTFSLSDQKMYVDGIFGNKEHTDVMVLLRMQDAQNMSTDAKNYQLFVTGESSSIDYNPTVSFSMFGSTGYAIVRFQDTVPIKKEILSVTIRANAKLAITQDVQDTDVEDASFAKHDQARMYVNPGADDIQVIPSLVFGETDPARLYVSLVADAKDKAIRDKIKDQTKTLANLLNQATEYKNRLISAGYEPPATPWFVDGDYINNDGALVSARNVARAHIFDYSTKTIQDGYIKQVMGGMSEYDKYMSKHSEDDVVINSNDVTNKNLEQVVRVDKLKYKDGSWLNLKSVALGVSPSSQVAAQDSVEALQTVWRSYLSGKSKIQRNLMRDLLVLDADVQSQEMGFSEQTNKKSIVLY